MTEAPVPTERTLALIKTRAMLAGQTNAILSPAIAGGLTVLAQRRIFDPAKFTDLYAEHEDRPYYYDLMNSVDAGPDDPNLGCMAVLFEGHNAIRFWRALMGPTDPRRARAEDPNSIRAIFGGEALPDNAVHGSDSPESAEREIAIFFPELTKPVRRWLPSAMMDESIPTPRAAPDQWIIKGPDGWYIAGDDETEFNHDFDPTPIKNGDVISFDWTENFGTRTLQLFCEGDKRWLLHGEEPIAPDGVRMFVAEVGDPETMGDGLEDFVSNYFAFTKPEDTTIDVHFYCWSFAAASYEFRDGLLFPVAQTAAKEATVNG